MILIRVIVLHNLCYNIRITMRHVRSKANEFPDLLSRLKYRQFWRRARETNRKFENSCTKLPEAIWPMEKIWWNQATSKKGEKEKIELGHKSIARNNLIFLQNVNLFVLGNRIVLCIGPYV